MCDVMIGYPLIIVNQLIKLTSINLTPSQLKHKNSIEEREVLF